MDAAKPRKRGIALPVARQPGYGFGGGGGGAKVEVGAGDPEEGNVYVDGAEV
jgi:hypothetical protein